MQPGQCVSGLGFGLLLVLLNQRGIYQHTLMLHLRDYVAVVVDLLPDVVQALLLQSFPADVQPLPGKSYIVTRVRLHIFGRQHAHHRLGVVCCSWGSAAFKTQPLAFFVHLVLQDRLLQGSVSDLVSVRGILQPKVRLVLVEQVHGKHGVLKVGGHRYSVHCHHVQVEPVVPPTIGPVGVAEVWPEEVQAIHGEVDSLLVPEREVVRLWADIHCNSDNVVLHSVSVAEDRQTGGLSVHHGVHAGQKQWLYLLQQLRRVDQHWPSSSLL